MASKDATTTVTDEEQIRSLHRGMLDAWGAGDGTAFSAPFAEDAVFIAFDGSLLYGRTQIAASHQELFDRWLKGTRLVEERTDIRFVSANVAIVHSFGGTVRPGRTRAAPEHDSVQTLLAVKDEGAWSFVSFQNTRIRPIATNGISALLWLVPDKLWAFLFRVTRMTPRTAVASGLGSEIDRRQEEQGR